MARTRLLLTGQEVRGHSKQLILETQMLPGHPGHHVATNTEDGTSQVSLVGRMADVGSFPATKETQISLGGLQLHPPKHRNGAWDQKRFLQGTYKILSTASVGF